MQREEVARGAPGDSDLQMRGNTKNYCKENAWNVSEDAHGQVEERGTKSGSQGHLIVPDLCSHDGGTAALRQRIEMVWQRIREENKR
jgi:hypothetical protein